MLAHPRPTGAPVSSEAGSPCPPVRERGSLEESEPRGTSTQGDAEPTPRSVMPVIPTEPSESERSTGLRQELELGPYDAAASGVPTIFQHGEFATRGVAHLPRRTEREANRGVRDKCRDRSQTP